jgi:hypothetical protein
MFDKWFFVTVLAVTLVVAIPLIVIWLVLQLSPELRLVATVAIIVLWGVVSGYKDWLVSKRKEKEDQRGRFDLYFLISKDVRLNILMISKS